MRTNLLLTRLAQADLVVNAQGGAGRIGGTLLRRIESLDGLLLVEPAGEKRDRLLSQRGMLDREYRRMLEDAGQGTLL